MRRRRSICRGLMRERALVRLDGLGAVARLLVERAQEREAREVVRVLVLELLDEHRQLLVGAVDLGDDLVDLGAQRASPRPPPRAPA